MKRFQVLRYVVIALCLALAGGQNRALADESYRPKIGQAGKDVIWVPTPQKLVEVMLDMANVTPADFVIDLGSGDGNIVIAAAQRGARAHGIEYNPDLVEFARCAAAKAGVSDRATFEHADIFASDFSQATVVTLFLTPKLNMDLRPKILDLTPGTRVVSYNFGMGDWKPDLTRTLEGDTSGLNTAHLWIVPAVWPIPAR